MENPTKCVFRVHFIAHLLDLGLSATIKAKSILFILKKIR